MAITKKMFVECIKREVALSLPVRKKTNLDHQRPLWAWMQGAKKCAGRSKIEAVLSNQCGWPWYSKNAAGQVFCTRIKNKKSLTWIQKTLLREYVSRNYPGRHEHTYWGVDLDISFPDQKKVLGKYCAGSVEKFFYECMEKAKINPNQSPLRLILSPELSILINLKFMELYK